ANRLPASVIASAGSFICFARSMSVWLLPPVRPLRLGGSTRMIESTSEYSVCTRRCTKPALRASSMSRAPSGLAALAANTFPTHWSCAHHHAELARIVAFIVGDEAIEGEASLRARGEAHAMDPAGTELAQRFLVLRRGVALVLREAVAGEFEVEPSQLGVARDLGQHRRRHDAAMPGVAADDRLHLAVELR